jgi:NADH dehydrogenase
MYPIAFHFSRKLNDLMDSNNQNINMDSKQTVYVIGNGWGSYYFTKNLDKNKFNPIIIAPNTRVLNTPKLTNRIIDPNAIVEFDNPNGLIINDILEDIDLENKFLITKFGSTYKYDKVVLSIGSEPNDFGIPGVNEYAYKFKTIQDADILRERISRLYTNSRIYIVGAGITGIEMASRLNKIGCDITIIEGLGEILFGYEDETKKIILNEFKLNYKNININLNQMVKSIDKSTGLINTFDNLKKMYGHPYPFNINNSFDSDIVIWTGGVRFNGFGKTKLFEKLNQITPIKPRGLDVEKDFLITSKSDKSMGIYCIGDMVANKGPPSAQNVKNQAIWLAGYFNSNFDSAYLLTNPYKIMSNGKLIHLEKNVIAETKYYSGPIPKLIDKIIEFFQI